MRLRTLENPYTIFVDTLPTCSERESDVGEKKKIVLGLSGGSEKQEGRTKSSILFNELEA